MKFLLIFAIFLLIARVSGEITPQQPLPQFDPSATQYIQNAASNQLLHYPGAWDTYYGEDSAVTDFDLFAQGVQVYDYSPKWAHLSHGSQFTLTNQIEITGCGFSTHSEVTCIFEYKTTSLTAWILDDNTIICVLPERSLSDLSTLPQYQRLDLVFDGEFYLEKNGASSWDTSLTNYIYVGQFRWGPEIDALHPIFPTADYTTPANRVTINGQGFQDPLLVNSTDVSLIVYFDDIPATDIQIVDDNTITVVPPSAPELYISRIVKLVWVYENGNTTRIEAFLVSNTLYFYGPEIISLSPACVNYDGSSELTIFGLRFDDPLLEVADNYVSLSGSGGTSSANKVRIGVSISGVTWSSLDGDLDSDYLTSNTPLVTYLEAFGDVDSSGTRITFLPPNFIEGISGGYPALETARAALNSAVATVQDIRFQSNYRFSLDQSAVFDTEVFQFTYGSFFDSTDEDLWFGGQTSFCVYGCIPPNERANFTRAYSLWIANTDGADYDSSDHLCAYNSGTSTLGPRTVDATSFCCQTTPQVQVCSTQTVSTIYLGQPDYSTNTDPITDLIAVGTGNVAYGPAIPGNQHTRTSIIGGQVTIEGSRLKYSHGFSNDNFDNHYLTTSLVHGCAVNLAFTNSREEGTASSSSPLEYFEIVASSSDDNQLTFDIGPACFGETLSITGVDFSRATVCSDSVGSITDICCQRTFSAIGVDFGPTCEVTTDRVGLQAGTLELTGFDLGSYSPRLRICDAHKFSNTEVGTLPALPVDPVTGQNRNRCHLYDLSDQIGGSSYNPPDVLIDSTTTTNYYAAASQIVTAAPSASGDTLSFNVGDFAPNFAPVGRRTWGQEFDAVLIFNTVQDQIYFTDTAFQDAFWSPNSTSGYDFFYTQLIPSCRDQITPSVEDFRITHTGLGASSHTTNYYSSTGSCYSFASIQCNGRFSFGPTIEDLNPCQGPSGKADSFTPTSVTIEGLNINDPWPTTGAGNSLVSFGTLFGTPSGSGSSLNVDTVWGATSHAQFSYSVSAFFETLNITWSDKISVHWGPVLTGIETSYTADYDDDGDIWGFFPGDIEYFNSYNAHDGPGSIYYSTLTLTGYGFFYGKNYENKNPANDDPSSDPINDVTIASGIRVTVDGVSAMIVDAYVQYTGSGYDSRAQSSALKIIVPARRWGTDAEVCISWDQAACATVQYGEDYFGEDFNQDVYAYTDEVRARYDDDASRYSTWQSEIESVDAPHAPLCFSQRLHYDLKIYGDDTNGVTSGNTAHNDDRHAA